MKGRKVSLQKKRVLAEIKRGRTIPKAVRSIKQLQVEPIRIDTRQCKDNRDLGHNQQDQVAYL